MNAARSLPKVRDIGKNQRTGGSGYRQHEALANARRPRRSEQAGLERRPPVQDGGEAIHHVLSCGFMRGASGHPMAEDPEIGFPPGHQECEHVFSGAASAGKQDDGTAALPRGQVLQFARPHPDGAEGAPRGTGAVAR